MAHRRIKALTSSTPSVANPSKTFFLASEASDPSTISDNSSLVIGQPQHEAVFPKMTTLEWVIKAIETVGVPRKGASYLAILKWIVNNKEDVVINRLKSNLRKAIEKALENGLIKRPAISKDVTGLRGYFIKNKDATSLPKIPKNKPVKKLVEITNVNKTVKIKTAATKPKAVTQSKGNAEKATKTLKQPTTTAKENHNVINAGLTEPSTNHKTQPKSRTAKPNHDKENGPPKIKLKSLATKPNPYAKTRASRRNFDDVAETQNHLQAQGAESNLHDTAGPSAEANIAKPKTKKVDAKHQNQAQAAKSKLDAVAEPSDKRKARARGDNAEARPKTQAKLKTTTMNLDGNTSPKAQPKAKATEFNPDTVAEPGSKPEDEARTKTQHKSKTAKAKPDGKTGQKTRIKVKPTEEILQHEPVNQLDIQSKTIAVVKPRQRKLPTPALKDVLPAIEKKGHHKKATKASQKTHSKPIKPTEKTPPNISDEESPLKNFEEELSGEESTEELDLESQHSTAQKNNHVSKPKVIYSIKLAKAKKVTKNFEMKKVNKKETSEAGPSTSRATRRNGKNNTAVI